jgi:plasmid maintenance system antidote protein VapI
MKKTGINIGEIIHQELDKRERSVAWLADKIGCHRTTMSRMLEKYSIDSEVLFQISYVLDVDYHALYCQKLKDRA